MYITIWLYTVTIVTALLQEFGGKKWTKSILECGVEQVCTFSERTLKSVCVSLIIQWHLESKGCNYKRCAEQRDSGLLMKMRGKSRSHWLRPTHIVWLEEATCNTVGNRKAGGHGAIHNTTTAAAKIKCKTSQYYSSIVQF